MSLLDESAPDAVRATEIPLRRNRDFLLLWIGAGVSMLGLRASVVAYPLLMLWYGNSPIGAGLVGFAVLLPQLVVQLPAGALVDRWDRRRLLIGCDIAGLLAMGAVVVMLAAGRLWLPALMVAAFIDGSAGVCYRLGERAAIGHIVPPPQLPQALGQNEARSQAAGLLGQPTGSGLFTLGSWVPFGFTAGSHLLALVTLLFIRKNLQGRRGAATRNIRAEVIEGMRWVWRQRFLRTAVGLIAGSNLLFQILVLTMSLTVKEHGGSPLSVGLIGLVGGLGGMAGALAGARVVERVRLFTVIAGALVVWTVLMTPVALVSAPLVLGLLMAGTGFAGALMNVVVGVRQLRITPDALQGRVNSVFSLLSFGMSSAGAFVGGVLLSAIGTRATAVSIAAAMGVLALIAVVAPAMREDTLAESRQDLDPAHGA
ncbi:MFS transporter [Nocardia terpenica]|uniref:Multidrug transporter n=1 Tax=Nocardia terpenica TaxID=455432 RepID=A0A164J159_9NOCA|nr:MFS transporter [Nocardia terpenica]KZM69939.1 multidrug transporter [Nocardia terpenica]MBF6065943.1 MFS transporter [Nocardia terpenica]MBF6108861.1 MFS transporter [Nocardia terpenica]MBF6116187.1 MFS transporter [Nocardia terpenica]MBF6123188.1 MFS transporter [Nocardia terpenica]